MVNLQTYPLPTLAERQQIGLATIAGDETAAAEARRDYYAKVIQNCVAKNLAKIPLALTDEQRKEIIALLAHDPSAELL